MELVEQLQDVEAIIVDRDGRVLISSGLRNRVRLSPRARRVEAQSLTLVSRFIGYG